jgi:hypothetical protein
MASNFTWASAHEIARQLAIIATSEVGSLVKGVQALIRPWIQHPDLRLPEGGQFALQKNQNRPSLRWSKPEVTP